ncbi:MAG: twin-arginine translocation signal domain-containing protein [Rhodocyclaceae bacterium]|nr:twin-arginine translocation signal domain-containing protein [Rhodocyclaceae bacterium]MBP6279512.1 twin-arginine translocation signal domain-containing protein [Rhodocyclaceae bacterium]
MSDVKEVVTTTQVEVATTEAKPSRRKFLAAAATGSVGAVAAGFPMISVAQSPITMR